jgi:hypothetical protein
MTREIVVGIPVIAPKVAPCPWDCRAMSHARRAHCRKIRAEV